MYIEELTSKTNNHNIVVSMNYDEVRDIANGLYAASETDPKFKPMYGKCKVLFDMIKHGNIQPETVDLLNEIKIESEHQSGQKT